VHPTFGWWSRAVFEKGWRALEGSRSISLRALASACNAREIRWPGATSFFNVNAPDDLRAARKHIDAD
jgi:molybdopterin-guanine dinucleotide biosynthesis protein A